MLLNSMYKNEDFDAFLNVFDALRLEGKYEHSQLANLIPSIDDAIEPLKPEMQFSIVADT